MSSKEKRNSPGKTKILKYLQDYRFNSILVRSFIIILSFLIGIFTIVMITVYGKMDSIITEEVGNMSINSLIKTRDRVDVVMEEVVKISGQLSLDEDIQKFKLPDTNELFDHTQTVNVKEKIEMYAGVFDYIDSIYVYSNKSKYIVTNDGGGKISEFEDTNWLENLTEREYEPARMISRVKNNSYPNLISYIQPLRLTQMQFLGGIIVNVDVDILEELVGEIYDEHDEVVEYFKKVNDTTYIVDCDADIEDFFDYLGINYKEEYDFNTVAGFVNEHFDSIPSIGDEFEFEDFRIEVTEADQRQVKEVKVNRIEKPQEENTSENKLMDFFKKDED